MLKMSRTKLLWSLAASAILFALSVWMLIDGKEEAWAGVILAGMLTVLFFVDLLPSLFGFGGTKLEAAQLILSQFPGPAFLYSSRRKWAIVLFGCLGFSISMYFFPGRQQNDFQKLMLWAGFIFFCAGSFISIAVLLRPARLRLDAEGFEMGSLFKSYRVQWRNTSTFEVKALPAPTSSHQLEMVVYDDASAKKRWLAGFSTGLVGRNSGTSDTFGLTSESLAWLMNQWRERALIAQERFSKY